MLQGTFNAVDNFSSAKNTWVVDVHSKEILVMVFIDQGQTEPKKGTGPKLFI